MTKLDDCKTSCNENKLSMRDLENVVYSLVWRVSGADIYDDILGPNKYFINWGGYTNHMTSLTVLTCRHVRHVYMLMLMMLKNLICYQNRMEKYKLEQK